ncbi:MAG: glycoside hydrolase family 28 protein, partial [Terracidiphilus sp.]
SDDVLIRNVRILAPQHSPNTDAVDPFSSSNVRIDHLYADVGDDNIAIKSGAINSPGPDEPARDIIVTDCTFVHGHGLSIGSEVAGGAHHIVAERIHFEGTDNGISIKANRDRGNYVSDLVFRDIDMMDVKHPIVISEYYPAIMPSTGEVKPEPVTRLTPHFHNIELVNVKATGSEMAGAIIGLPEAPVTDVVLRNVTVSGKTGLSIGYANVTGQNVKVTATQGDAIIKLAGANVKLQ